MTDEANKATGEYEEHSHTDGRINVRLGNHAERLADLTGKPTPEEYPANFFEVADGQAPTLEQVRVLNFFAQEYRNVIALPISGEDTLTRIVKRIGEGPSFLEMFQKKVKSVKPLYDKANDFTGEAEELYKFLRRSMRRLQAGEFPKISVEQRGQILAETKPEHTRLNIELSELQAISNSGGVHTPEQAARFVFLQARLSELRSIISHYDILPLEEVKRRIQYDQDEIRDLEKKIDSFGYTKYLIALEDAKVDLQELQAISSDYQGYVARYTTEDVVPFEVVKYQEHNTLLRRAIDMYTGLKSVNATDSVQESLALIFRMTEAETALQDS